jgi:hypothetical protein
MRVRLAVIGHVAGRVEIMQSFNLYIYKQSHHRPWGFQQVEDPRFQDNRHMKVVRLSALRTGRLYPPRDIVRPEGLCQ